MILHHEFIKSAKKFGGKMAIIDKTTDKNVPFEKALIASLILAKKFEKYEEKYIGVMIPTSAGSFLVTVGLIMAGKVPAMINYSTGAAENSEYAQKKINFKTIITSKALLEKIGCRVVPGMVFIEEIMETISVKDKLSAALKSKMSLKAITRSFPKPDIDDNVVILFTSGSEKEPKAVQLTHRNIGSNLEDIMAVMGLSSDDVIMSILPLFHVFGLTTNFWLPMTQGMTAVTYANPLDYKRIPKLIKENGVTMIAGTPIFFSGYLRESDPGDFASVRLAVAGADKTPDSLREGYRKKHNLELLEGYGTTETSPVISVNRPDANRPGSIGPLLPSVSLKITDIETGKPLPTGKEGKVLVKGDLVMKGYFDDVEETSYRIKDGWYDTGDMGFIDQDGYLWHRGRLKRFVKIGGEMVSLVKTESVLDELLPEGVGCCVVEVPDQRKGARLVATVTGKVNEKEIIKAMSKKLHPIAIPSQFLVISEMPKLGSGKMDFRRITEMVREMITQ
ncbi:MAG TPA: bifunctional acyl-ACP--phospholipid O-acyltransferase/long-chain-fatty-acid--ACP ligase [bacterium]|nr:bifunctional acyl-ACP--phospholipid O-acyltransferase/long-chain-fatty-acid--ACP ligase [bacterium]